MNREERHRQRDFEKKIRRVGGRKAVRDYRYYRGVVSGKSSRRGGCATALLPLPRWGEETV